jgi:hypothetical protein
MDGFWGAGVSGQRGRKWPELADAGKIYRRRRKAERLHVPFPNWEGVQSTVHYYTVVHSQTNAVVCMKYSVLHARVLPRVRRV